MNLRAGVESHLDSSKKTKKSTFKKKVTIKESQHDIVQGTSVVAGGDVLINGQRNADGSLSIQQSGDVNIVGGNLQAGQNLLVAGNDINIVAQTYTDYKMQSVSKKSFGGLKSKAKLDAEQTQKLSSSQLLSSGDVTLIAGDDVTIGGSELLADGDINIVAFDEVLISAGEESSQVESLRKKGGFLSGGSLYSSKEKMQGETASTAYSALLDAGGNINMDVGRATVVGSDIIAAGSLDIATDIGDIEVLAAQETLETYSNERKIEVGFGDALKGLSNPSELVKVEDGQLKLSIGNATYDKVEFSNSSTTQRGSTLAANDSVTLNSVADILVKGSDIVGDADQDADSTSAGEGNLNLYAGGNVSITAAENSYEETTKATHGAAEVSVVVQNQAVEVAKSALALKEATGKVKQAETDYRRYQKEREGLESKLVQLEAEYAADGAGVTYTDLIELRELVEDVKGDEDWYVAGVALAAADVTMKGVNVAQQIEAGVATSAIYGFNAGVQLDIDATKTDEQSAATTSRASTLSANNVNIVTGLNNRSDAATDNLSTTLIQGSDIDANGSVNITTGTLDIQASRDTSSSSSEMQNGHITIAQTLGGAAGGPTVSASYNRNQSQDKTTTYNNSTLSGTDINISTTGDSNIQGGNVAAINSLNLDVGGDLTLESKQNRTRGSNKGFGISGGFGFDAGTQAPDATSTAVGSALSSLNGGTDVATTSLGDTSGGVGSINGGLNASSGRYQTRETVLSSLTGDKVNINVEGNSNIVGALIAAQDSEGNDNGNVTFDTGSLSFTDLSNTSYSSEQSAGINLNVGIGDTQAAPNSEQAAVNDTNPANPANPTSPSGAGETASNSLDINSSQYTYRNTSSIDKSKTLATIGQGNVTVGSEGLGEGETADININRDTDNVDKELYSIDRQQGNIDLTVDHEQVGQAVDEIVEKSQVALILATEDASTARDLKVSFIDDSDMTWDGANALLATEDVQNVAEQGDNLNAIVNIAQEGGTVVKNDVAAQTSEVTETMDADGNLIQTNMLISASTEEIGPYNALSYVTDTAGDLAVALEQVDPMVAQAIEIGIVASQGVKGAVQYVTETAIANSPVGELMETGTRTLATYLTEQSLSTNQTPEENAALLNGPEQEHFKQAYNHNEKGSTLIVGAAIGTVVAGGITGAIKAVGDKRRGSGSNSEVNSDSDVGRNSGDEPGAADVESKLPEGAHSLIGADKAIINPSKLTEYALNPVHPVGKHKARVFESALGFNKNNAGDLMKQIQQGVKNNTPIAGKIDQYGERFTVDIPVTGPKGSGVVTSGWIYKPGSDVPELTTILVKK
jgi:hypothetical protein